MLKKSGYLDDDDDDEECKRMRDLEHLLEEINDED